MKFVLRLLALSCLLWGGCGDGKPPSPAASESPGQSEPAQAEPLPSPPQQQKPPPAPGSPVQGPSPTPGSAPAPAASPAPPPGATPSPDPTRAPAATPENPVAKPAQPEQPAATAQISLDARLEQMFPFPHSQPLDRIVRDWEEVSQALVEAVSTLTVNTATEYKLFANGMEIGATKVPPGHHAKPLKFRPGQLLVTNSRDGNTRAVVNLDDTDFRDQVRTMYHAHVEASRQEVAGMRKAAKAALAASFPAGQEPPADLGKPDSDPRFKPAVDYLASGKMLTRTLQEAKQWIWAGQETIQGRAYEVILVMFEVPSLFGPSPQPMKCLLEDARVVKWIPAAFAKPE